LTEQQILDAIEYQLNVQLSFWLAIANGPENEIAANRATIELARQREDALKNALSLMEQIAAMGA
jgi:hypothetical protein